MTDHIKGDLLGHSGFLYGELAGFIRRNPFATRFRAQIANAIIDLIYGDDFEISVRNPSIIDAAELLFYWIETREELPSDWMQTEEGEWIDDDGEIYADAIPETIDGCAQLAALGLSVIEDGTDAGSMMLAYKCLVYAQRLQLGTALSEAETAKLRSFDFSKSGKNGAEKRHARMKKLREWTIEQYKAGRWSTISSAAFDLKDSVIAHGRTLGAILTPTNAQRTIQLWISNNKNNTA